jgi:DNA helicase-2/ATP-dependent DNA helicase PcrA
MSDQTFLAECKPVDTDNAIDERIKGCLVGDNRQSFITFAGAGSGKTYSLKEALNFVLRTYGQDFASQGKQAAVVTFTNNAADEIIERIERSSMFAVSTIHSFCWSMIGGFNDDIRQWYISSIPSEIAELQEMERRGRAGAASDARKRRISRLEQRLEWLTEPRTFIYDPNGVNTSQNSLSHADVLKIFAHFVAEKSLMADIIVNKFPFIFVDESQDTDKEVINALFQLQNGYANNITVGLFGDVMQRIFGGGEPELGRSVPKNWVEFDKQMNHRSARRIVGLGNQIRGEDDKRQQFAKDGSEDGYVRFFLLPPDTADKEKIEEGIRAKMADTTGDTDWTDINSDETAVLLLEHKMASRRLGFLELTETLTKSGTIRGRIFEGDCSELNYFTKVVLPLAEAGLMGDNFEVMALLRANKSPLLEEAVFRENESDPLLPARKAEEAFRATVANANVTFLEVLDVIAANSLLEIPAKLRSFVSKHDDEAIEPDTEHTEDNSATSEEAAEGETEDGDEVEAWSEALQTPFFQARGYRDYIEDKTIYRTHQGVKGNEFDRVMAIMGDDEAGGFMFSYEQYFGAKAPSAATIKKMEAGEETGQDRTRRLFYVTSTRAKSSLAHVIYTSDVEAVRSNLIKRGFASENEIAIL